MEHNLDSWMTMIWRVLLGIGDSVFEERNNEKERDKKERENRGGEKVAITVKHHY